MRQNFIPEKVGKTPIIWLQIFIAFSAFSFFYQASIKTLFNYWNDYGTYSHGFLTILLTVFLLYTCVKNDRFSYSGPSIVSAFCIAILSLIWLIAYVSEVNTIQMLCMPFFVYFILTYFVGLKNYRILLVPVFILLFTIPVWQSILPALQDSAVYVTNKLLSLTNLEYRMVDNKIVISNGIFEIEESCSGLRYLLVGVLLSIVYGFLNYKSYWSTLILVLISVVIMLIGNYIRILVVIGLGVMKGMDNPLVQDHESLGWVLFAIFLIPLFTIARYLNPNLWEKSISKKSFSDNAEKRMGFSMLMLTFVVYLIVIAFAPLYANYIQNNITNMASFGSKSIQLDSEWEGPILLSSRWAPSYSSYSERINEQFVKNEKMVALNSYLYTKQVPKGELINANNQMVNKDKWKVSDLSMHQVVIDKVGKNSTVVNKLTIDSLQVKDCLRIWYWFEVNGIAYTKKWQVKLNEAVVSIKGNSGSAIMSIATSCNDNADIILSDFLFDNFSQLNNLIDW